MPKLPPLSRRTVFVFVSIAIIALVHKWLPSIDSYNLLLVLLALGGWVLGDGIRQDPTAAKWVNLFNEPRFRGMLVALTVPVARMLGFEISDQAATGIVGIVTSWIISNSIRKPDAQGVPDTPIAPIKGKPDGTNRRRRKPRTSTTRAKKAGPGTPA